MNKMLVIFLLVVGSAGFYLLLKEPTNPISNKSVIVLSSENDDNIADVKTISLEEEKSKSSLKKLDEKVKQNFNETINWERDHFGYFLTNVNESDYNSYDIEALELLAEQFDIKALDMLASKYLEAGNRKMSIDANQRAAILGSTVALISLGNQLAPFHTGPDWMLKDSHARVMNQLSYMQAALIRGDKKMISFMAMTLAHHKDLLNDEDIKTIQLNGRNIYDQLEVNRTKLGLSPFHKSVPWYVDEHSNKSNQRIINKLGIDSSLLSL